MSWEVGYSLGKEMKIKVGEDLLGRVLDALGRPMDSKVL